jgi:hypothetical protein
VFPLFPDDLLATGSDDNIDNEKSSPVDGGGNGNGTEGGVTENPESGEASDSEPAKKQRKKRSSKKRSDSKGKKPNRPAGYQGTLSSISMAGQGTTGLRSLQR